MGQFLVTFNSAYHSLSDRPAGFDIHDDGVVGVDQVVGGKGKNCGGTHRSGPVARLIAAGKRTSAAPHWPRRRRHRTEFADIRGRRAVQ